MFRFQKQSNEKKPQNVGFYIALAVCLTAIGASAWTTFDSVASLRRSASVAPSSVQPVNRPVSGVPAGEPASGVASAVSQPVSAPTPQPSSRPAARAESQASSQTASRAVSRAEPKPASSAAPVTATTYILPVNGAIQKQFGQSLYARTFGDWRAHNGVDIAAAIGSNVMAIGDGTVQSFAEDPMLGGVLVIRHGALDVYYCGLGDNPSVQAGDTVRCGQVIGILKDVPSETVEDAHLHLQIRQDGKWVEPLAAIGKENLLPSESNVGSHD